MNYREMFMFPSGAAGSAASAAELSYTVVWF